MSSHDCDVLIVGCGPTGVTLANLLGRLGVRVVALERDREVYPVPRATHIDEETLRNFQATGLMDALLPHTTPFGSFEVVGEDGKVLLRERVAEPGSVHGYEGSHFFYQPAFERILREGLGRFPNVRFETGVEVVSVDGDSDGVTVVARDPEEQTRSTFRAAWVVGCDGGRSVARSALGVETESLAPPRSWLIVDTLLRDAADAERLPGCFRYVLDPNHLTIYAHGIGVNRRWEFQLGRGEEMPLRTEVCRWISAFIDPARLEITRMTTYMHNALLARRWRVGRVFLAGDAAHMMPPSAGQGMCSGIRDAVNLAWKLERVVAGRAGEEILDTYEAERAPHVREVLEGTLFIGRRLQADTPFERWRRRAQFRAMSSVPFLLEFMRRFGLRRPTLGGGVLASGSKLAGRPLPQVPVRRDGVSCLLDDVLGYRFSLVVRDARLADEAAAWALDRDVGVWRLGEDLVESSADTDGGLSRWMRDGALDFALVRPDRYLFAAGRASELPRAQAAFDRWFRASGVGQMAVSPSAS